MNPFRLAIIDLGTNSVRFDVYELIEGNEVERIFREKQMIRLGEGVFKTGKLVPEAVGRALEAFQYFATLIKKYEVNKIVAFATSAVREAQDAKSLIKKIFDKTGISLRVIVGEEEARLIAKGILNNEQTPNGVYSLIDIGGGSTEISICYKKTILDCYSFNLGAYRLQQTFLKTSPPEHQNKKDPLEQMRKHIRSAVDAVVAKRKWPSIETLLGSSGTILSIKSILEASGEKVAPYEKKSIAKLVARMNFLTTEELLKMPGMEAKRVDIILAGTVLLDELMSGLKAKQVFTTRYALRDGILDQEIENILK